VKHLTGQNTDATVLYCHPLPPEEPVPYIPQKATMNWHSGVKNHFITRLSPSSSPETLAHFWITDKWPPTAPSPWKAHAPF